LQAEMHNQVPEYGDALGRHSAASKYIQGFSHAYGSGAPAETAADADLRSALATPEWQQGHANGIMTCWRNRAA
jgi:hypothetical protein